MISPDTIALVRDRTDLVALIAESVPSLKRLGRRWVGLCPFHQEKTPSFNVNQENGRYFCFGCKASGDAFEFLIQAEGLSFSEAVRALAERAGVEITEERAEKAEVDRQRRHRDELYAANQVAATYFERQLREHPDRAYALDELDRRGLLPSWARGDGAARPPAEGDPVDATLHAFRVGYAPASWEGLTQFLKVQGISPVSAEAVGLIAPRSSTNGYYDRFYHRLMFAVLDLQGRVVAFSGRALVDPPGQPPRERKPAKYINSPESPIYTKGHTLFGLYQARHAIRQQQQAVLVEGNFDVVSLHARGLASAVAPLGTAFTFEQAKLITRFAPSVVFLFDGDAAGKKAVAQAREACHKAGLAAKVASLPDALDPDEFVRNRTTQDLRHVIAQARGLLEHLIEQALDETFVASDAFERARRVEQVGKVLKEQDDPMVRSMAKAYADQLAGRLDLVRAGSPEAFRALEQSVRKALASATPPPPLPHGEGDPRRVRVRPKAPGSAERTEMVGAILDFPALLDLPEVQSELALLEGLSARVVAAVSNALRLERQGEKILDSSRFLAQVPATIHAFAAERLAAPRHDTLEQARVNFLDNAQKLGKMVLARETTELAREQQRVAGDWQSEAELAREADRRTRARLKHIRKHEV